MNNSQIHAVFFDLGQVLVEFDWGDVLRQFAARSGKSESEIFKIVADTIHETHYELGGMSTAEFVRLVTQRCGVSLTLEQFETLWCDIFRENPEMVALARSLRGVAHRHVLSNTNELHIDFIHRRFPFMEEFDGHTYSFRERVAKPGPEIYRLALARAGVDAARSLFIDDREENVLGARQVGMHAVHYTDKIRAMKEIKQWLQLD